MPRAIREDTLVQGITGIADNLKRMARGDQFIQLSILNSKIKSVLGGGQHDHAIMRWSTGSAPLTLELPDYVDEIEWVANNGAGIGPFNYSLSADGTQLTLVNAPVNG